MRKDATDKQGKRQRFRIGDIEVHPDRDAIVRGGQDIGLARRTMDLLVALANAKGETLTRTELLANVWKNTELDDNPITKTVCELRDKLGDDPVAPRYIKTVRGGGYRTAAPIVFAKSYRRRQRERQDWYGDNPYVGLAAFDERHAEVFFGRTRVQETVMRALRIQLDNGRRFVLLHGASGSGKTSLLRAGILPKLTRLDGGNDLLALAVAHCDLASAQSGDSLGALAIALTSWTLDGNPVFPPQGIEEFKTRLLERPESIEHDIGEAFQRHSDRKAAEHPSAHLLLVIDHAEKLVDAASTDPTMHERFARALAAVCDSERTLTIMIVRGDFYLKLQDALPDLIKRKGSDGHIDVLRPQQWEIAEMIRDPAECADVDFEQDVASEDYLDNRLLDDAQGKPDVLPLLQHTLHQLFEHRDQVKGLLTFTAYRAMGGLEGAIAHRAEEVFNALPPGAQSSLDRVLSQLILIQDDSDAVNGRRAFIDTLDRDAKVLVEAFIGARLFASDGGDQRPRFGVAHEALLRQWPRAVEWSERNKRLLKAHAELRNAAERWHKLGRQKDHLLNPGRPLLEALELERVKNIDLSEIESDLLHHSNRQRIFNARLRRSAIVGLFLLSMASITMALIAINSRQEADRQRLKIGSLAAFLIGEFADRLDTTGNLKLIQKITDRTLEYCLDIKIENATANELITCSRASRKKGEVLLDQSDYKGAKAHFDRSTALSGKALSIEPDAKSSLNEAGQSAAWAGKFHLRTDDLEGARAEWRRYLGLTNALTSKYPNDAESQMQKSYALTNLGYAELELGRHQNAFDYFSESKSIKQKALNSQTKRNPEHEFELAVTASLICNLHRKLKKNRAASECYAEQIHIIDRLLVENQEANDWKRQLANLMQFHAAVELELGQTQSAREIVEKSINQLSYLNKIEPKNHSWANHLVIAHRLASEISIVEKNKGACLRHIDLAMKKINDYGLKTIASNQTKEDLTANRLQCISL